MPAHRRIDALQLRDAPLVAIAISSNSIDMLCDCWWESVAVEISSMSISRDVDCDPMGPWFGAVICINYKSTRPLPTLRYLVGGEYTHSSCSYVSKCSLDL